jgi:hypothetical protein
MNSTLVSNDVIAPIRIQLEPLELAISDEEILADLLYPGLPVGGSWSASGR